MVTTYEQAGVEKGIEQGIERGVEQGKQQTLILLLEDRFGPLTDDARQKIQKIHAVAELDSLILAVHRVRSMDELPL